MTPTPHETTTPSASIEAEGPQHVPGVSQPPVSLHGTYLPPTEHRVQFYQTDAFLFEVVGDFLGAGLGAGAACIVIATPDHRDGLAQRLEGQGCDLSSAQRQGQYVALDAAETLAQFLVEGVPDPARFAQVVGGLIERAAKGHRPVRLFGEMVALLWAEGHQTEAVQLESLWEELRSTAPPFSLLCAYPMSLFADPAQTDLFTRMCALHGQLIPDEGFPQAASQEEQLRVVSLYRQKALSLEAEMAAHQAAQERLRLSEHRYRRLFESSTDGILLVDPSSGRITDANPAFLRLVGRTHDQVVSQELWQVGLLSDPPTQSGFLRQVQQERVVCYEPITLATTVGEPIQVEWVSTLFRANGHAVLQCNLRDITDRQRAEEARQHLAAIVASSDDAILSKDLNGIITSWNAAAEHLYGYNAQEIVGQPVSRLFPPDRQDEFVEIMERLRRGERIEHFETLRVCKNGSVVPVSVTISPVKDAQGVIVGASAIARDISAQKALERQREAFISLVTHELKTPLTSLRGNLQLAQRRLVRLLGQSEQANEEQQRALEDMLSLLGRSQQPLRVQQRLIDDLLDLSHLQEDKLEINLAICDLVGLVAETVQDQQAAHPDRLITVCVPEEDPILVAADRDRLQQVLNNYLTNALKFSPESEPVQVGITLEAERARVWVEDHGPGLSAEQQAHIWQQFYQASTTPVQSGWKPGLGLGLYVSRQLMLRQQGQVGVESRPGQGATFWFSLPLQHPAPPRENVPQAS